MSWVSRIENIQFTIKTGDGKIFTPLWKNGIKKKAYNFEKFDFINVSKSFIRRERPQSGKFPLVFWFQGDKNIEEAELFEKSADDSRQWEIKHPFYGNIKGQPVSLIRNDLNLNVTEIKVEFWESINKGFPNQEIAFDEVVFDKTNSIKETSNIVYSEKVNPTSKDVNILNENIIQISSVFDKLFDNETFSEFQKLRSESLANANNLISAPIDAINSINSLLLSPSLYIVSVNNRLVALKDAFGEISRTLEGSLTRNTKLLFESQGSVILSAMCQVTVTPIDGDYITKKGIEGINSLILEVYNDYLTKLDESQVELSELDESFHSDVLVQTKLFDLITETTGNLFTLAFEAKQERTIEVDKNTNLILLTHKYIGLDADDQNIIDFRELNNIRSNELLIIPKGRIIKYFV